MIKLHKLLQEQGTKKWPPTGLDEEGAIYFIKWMQSNRPSAYEQIGLSIDLAKDPEHPKIREAWDKFGTNMYKTDPDAKHHLDPNANDRPSDKSSDDGEIGWGTFAVYLLIGAFGIAGLSGLNKLLGRIAGTPSGRVISASMFTNYKNTALKRGISLTNYLENIYKKQEVFIANKQENLIKLTEQEKRYIQNALKNQAVRKLAITETTEWGVTQLKRRALTADELAIMVSADEATYKMFKAIEKDAQKTFSKYAPKRIKTVTVPRGVAAGKTGKMLNAEIAPEKLVYKKEHTISLTQFDQAAKGQITAADMAKTYNAMAPKGKLATTMPTSILRLKTFPTKESWTKHYQKAGIPVPTAKDAYIKDKIRFNFLRQ